MDKLKTTYDNVQGKKTYFVAALLAVYALLGLFLGKLDLNTALTDLFAAGAVFGFRSALNK